MGMERVGKVFMAEPFQMKTLILLMEDLVPFLWRKWYMIHCTYVAVFLERERRQSSSPLRVDLPHPRGSSTSSSSLSGPMPETLSDSMT